MNTTFIPISFKEKIQKIRKKIKINSNLNKNLKKPNWIKIKIPTNLQKIKYTNNILRKNNLYTVCEEASCPNITECFHHGTATFMILGKICTRRCSFCNVNYGRPKNLNQEEPEKLSKAIKEMNLKYVVITSVNRDDLKDGGASHFYKCIRLIRLKNPNIKIEILVPDFRNCINKALKILSNSVPDVFNHNLESVPRLYKKVRPGANYYESLKLLRKFKKFHPNIPTKSGLMLGLGEKKSEIMQVLNDLRNNKVTMLTLGQYLQPTKYHLPVKRYIDLKEFHEIKEKAIEMGFKSAFCGPFVRSSYHAELQNKI